MSTTLTERVENTNKYILYLSSFVRGFHVKGLDSLECLVNKCNVRVDERASDDLVSREVRIRELGNPTVKWSRWPVAWGTSSQESKRSNNPFSGYCMFLGFW
jgi:hypothetical protein